MQLRLIKMFTSSLKLLVRDSSNLSKRSAKIGTKMESRSATQPASIWTDETVERLEQYQASYQRQKWLVKTTMFIKPTSLKQSSTPPESIRIVSSIIFTDTPSLQFQGVYLAQEVQKFYIWSRFPTFAYPSAMNSFSCFHLWFILDLYALGACVWLNSSRI